MATVLSRTPSKRVRRVDCLAYVLALSGLSFLSDPLTTVLAEGVTLAAVGSALLGLCMVGAAAWVYRNPEQFEGWRDPAPAYLWALAAVATAAGAVAIGVNLLRVV